MTLVRPAVLADVPATLAIYNDAVLHTTAVYDEATRNEATQCAWFEAKREAGLPILVADVDGGVAAFASYGNFRPWPGFRYTVESSIYVAPQRRGQGIGGLLLPVLIDEATQRGYHAMIAGVDATNEASLRLHERCGFTRVAYLREVGWKHGRWLDLVFLQRLLATVTPTDVQR